MGWLKRAVVLFVGLALLGSGFWLFGLLCFAYVALTFRRGKATNATPKAGRAPPLRYILSGALGFLCLLALGSGGTLSPVVFGSLAAAVFLWPHLSPGGLSSRAVPVKDTILLRSSLVPFVWHSVAEVKPGAEDFARALSSFEGRLLIFKPGTVYAHVKTLALDAATAEEKAAQRFRVMAGSLAPGGAYLLPLNGEASLQLLGRKPVPLKSAGPLVGPVPDLLVFDSAGGYVSRSGAYNLGNGPTSAPVIPDGTRPLRSRSLTWDVLDGLAKKLKWPQPDSFSNLLQSVHAARNEPLAERLGSLESSESGVAIQSLAGDRVLLSRAQLRAILTIYS